MLVRVFDKVYVEPAEILHITETGGNAVIKWKLVGGVAISDLTVTGATAQEVIAALQNNGVR